MKIVAKEIDIITVFDKKGNINPIRFKFAESDSSKVIKIDKVVTITPVKFAGEDAIVYRCQSIIDDTEKVYELKYVKRTCQWYLYKI